MRHEFDLFLRRLFKGGETGQIPVKTSDEDFEFEWVDPPTGGGSKSYAYFVAS